MARPHLLLALLTTSALVAPSACSSGGSATNDVPGGDGGTAIVVTSSILGDVVQQLLGDAGTVRVIIPDGQDPHEYEPSAKDVEAIQHASLVVANGLGLEEGLIGVLAQAVADGVTVYEATDHITVRELGADDPVSDDERLEHGGKDPHLWTDPNTMLELAPSLSEALAAALDADLAAPLAAFEAEMQAVDATIRATMSRIPAGECRLVTGHESLGYFAARYGCTVIGAVIPSLSSSAESSAQDLARLRDAARSAGVRAIFTETGTPQQVAEQVADEIGVSLIELPSHRLPATGGYAAYLTELATKIADGLTGT